MPPTLTHWLSAYLFTQAVEVPIYTKAFPTRWWWAAGASTLTHPLVWFLFPSLFRHQPYALMVTTAEAFAVTAEALYFRALQLNHPWRWSLAANTASFLLGLLSRHLFHWP